MNRLLIAFIAASGLHGLLFFAPFTDPEIRSPHPLSFQKISVSLADSNQPFSRKKDSPGEEKIEAKKTPQPTRNEKRTPRETEVLPPELVDNIINTLQPIQKKKVSQEKATEKVPVFPVKTENDLSTESEVIQENDPGQAKASAEETKNNKQHSSPAAHIQKAVPLQHTNVPPPYPHSARLRGLEGLVEINVLVDSNGKVKEQQLVLSSGYSILDRAALKAVRKWNFSPGIKNGKIHEMWVTVPVRFQLINK
ncbi:MAG: energy transducer TonB [Desulfobulbaceae bacterium]|uniref:Energy transducer TonB n=1 Tax=Candidatus Desulfobia pelagia TaxID=2841692 RepID=A0A8J6TEJ3_9BACT|nr:energy transducer TonB [Candidatus Desulfobia pelagia]